MSAAPVIVVGRCRTDGVVLCVLVRTGGGRALASGEPTAASAGLDAAADHVALLEHTSVVSSEAAAELSRLRCEYVESWQRELLPRGLLTSEDVLRFWELRQAEYIASVGEKGASDLELEIKFLSTAAVTELLAAQQSSASTFTHINSICFFADGAWRESRVASYSARPNRSLS